MFFLEVEFSSEIEIETGDRFGSSWFSISRDELENTESLALGHTYCYPRFPYRKQMPLELFIRTKRHFAAL